MVEVTSGNQVMVMMAQQSFAPGFHWDRFSNGTFALADGSEYDIRVVGPDGIEQFRRSSAIQPHVRRRPKTRSSNETACARLRSRATSREPSR